MASARVQISFRASKDLSLVHTVHLQPMIKTHFSGKLVSSGTSDVVITSVSFGKTRLQKLMKMIIIIIIVS